MRSWQPPPPHFTSDYYHSRVALFQSRLDKDVKPDFLLIGDSMIERGRWDQLLDHCKVYNMGISGDCAQGVLKRISYAIDAQPKNLVVSIGTNDACWGYGDADYLEPMIEIINQLTKGLPTTLRMITTISPVTESVFRILKLRDTQVNQIIVSWNNELKRLATSTGWQVVDLYSDVVKNGELYSRLTTDGIHLNEEGYKIWSQMILRGAGLKSK